MPAQALVSLLIVRTAPYRTLSCKVPNVDYTENQCVTDQDLFLTADSDLDHDQKQYLDSIVLVIPN